MMTDHDGKYVTVYPKSEIRGGVRNRKGIERSQSKRNILGEVKRGSQNFIFNIF